MTTTRQDAAALVAGCDRLAWKVAYKFWRASGSRPGDLEDYHAAAVLGLWQATRKWEPGKGTKFSTYAYRWAALRVRGLAVRDVARGVYFPKHHGFVAVPTEPFSAVYDPDDDDRPFDPAAPAAAPGPRFGPGFWRAVDRLLPCRRMKLAVWLYYGCGWGDPDVARAFGCTRGRSQQIRQAALARLRKSAARLAKDLDLDPTETPSCV